MIFGVEKAVDLLGNKTHTVILSESGFSPNWKKQMEEALQAQGIAGAFDIVADLYAKEPQFAKDCHGYVHEIGEKAYELFAEGKDIELTPKTSYCGYGFYHGFMEILLLTSGDVQQAREFCAYVDNQLSSQAVGASAACYHGVGHGTVDGGDPRYWGDAQAMVKPGFEMCELVAETDFQLYLCATGVFNSIEILSGNPKYNLSQMQKDPFSICHSQPKEYREPCYTNMLPALLRFANNDFARAANIIEETIENDEDYAIRGMVISGLFHERLRLDPKVEAREKDVLLCRSLQERSHLPCIEGLAGGHMKYGEPEKEYVKGLAFCALDILAADEKEVCFEHILSRLRIWYSPEKSKEICGMVDNPYRKFCRS